MKRHLTAAILLLALMLTCMQPALALAEDGTAFLDCTYTVPEGREAFAANLEDGDGTTRFTLSSAERLSVEWSGRASGVLLSWYDINNPVTIELTDAEGGIEYKKEFSKTDYRMFIPVEDACRLEIRCKQKRTASLCELRVLAEGETPRYLSKPEAVDLMLILASVTEETDLMGGLLPLYAGEHDIRTAIVYVGRDYGYRVQEAFCAYEAMGIDVIPLFLQFEDHNTCSYDRMGAYWKSNKLKESLLSVLHACKPKVVVTCDPDDDFSMVRTPYTANTVKNLIINNASREKLSVQKLYTLSQAGDTCVDYTTPLVRYDGSGAQAVAAHAYDCYASEASFGTVIPEAGTFSLAYTTVGEDAEKNDLFEHIDRGDMLAYAEPTATPSPTPDPTPTPSPTPTPTAEPTTAPAVEAEVQQERRGLSASSYLLIAAGAAVIAAIPCLKKKRVLAIVLIGCAVILAAVGIVLGGNSREQGAHKPTETAMPAPTAAPSATIAPSPTPTVEPTPTPDPNAVYYRQEGEPQEVIVADYDGGHWEYRSDTLSVLIDRQLWEQDGRPQCMYVAHIRMREVDSFRAVTSSNFDVLTASEPPWRLARNYRAVLGITGDNLNNADVSFKGILIRHGRLYSDRDAEATLVMGNDMTMRVVHPGEVSGEDLIDGGVLHTFSFGPILVENGEVNPRANEHRVSWGNPRCGIGMVEPGHFVAIVADGRDPKRAFNITLPEFAEIFAEQGVEVAYNLDGGSSAAMIFMGEHINWHSGESPQRSWADALLWGYSRQVPDPTDPVAHTGEGAVY